MDDYTVTLKHSEKVFTVRPNELILDAAIRQGVEMPYSCRSGTCRTCIFEIKEGDAQALDVEDCMISQQEIDSGRRLLCMSVCKSNIVIEKIQPRRRQNGLS